MTSSEATITISSEVSITISSEVTTTISSEVNVTISCEVNIEAFSEAITTTFYEVNVKFSISSEVNSLKDSSTTTIEYMDEISTLPEASIFTWMSLMLMMNSHWTSVRSLTGPGLATHRHVLFPKQLEQVSSLKNLKNQVEQGGNNNFVKLVHSQVHVFNVIYLNIEPGKLI